MAYERELKVAIEAAQKAAAFVLPRAGDLDETDVRQKGIHDLVTYVDEESQRIIIDHVTDAFPLYEILAEEGESSRNRDREFRGHRWIIDPIDGTTNFTHGLPPFSISIALQADSDIVVAVIYELTRNEVFSATKGGGLRVNGRSTSVSTEAEMRNSLITTGFPFKIYRHVDSYLEVLRTFMYEAQGVRRPGSAAADLAYVAAGRFEGFFETGLSVWDVAGGALLVQEGGGRISDFSGSEDFLFSGHVIASNGRIHDDMLRICQPLREAVEGVDEKLP